MKLKNVLIALLMIIGTTLMAQEKYEQAVVKRWGNNVIISIEGKETVLEKSPIKTGFDFSFILDKLAELRNQGWEVWSSSSDGSGFDVTYFLRRKINKP